ncbi:MAG TPA: hypothetical protein VEW04_04830 [Allosphingosinicella sp.]|nr:hypothetical protein [Allosphingosinicella sp.]
MKLARMALIVLAASAVLVPILLRFRGDEDLRELREFYIFYAFGPQGPRLAGMTMVAIMAVAALLVAARLFRGRTAIAIRPGGIQLNGIVRSRFVPWASVEAVGLYHQPGTRLRRTSLAIRWRQLPGHQRPRRFRQSRTAYFPLAFLDATEEEVALWLRAFSRARPRPVFAPPPPRAQTSRRLPGRRPA